MKRKDALRKLEAYLYWNRQLADKDLAEGALDYLEHTLKMKPPSVGREDRQALMEKYIDPNFYIWDEDISIGEVERPAGGRRK